jgi:hypothetical protein
MSVRRSWIDPTLTRGRPIRFWSGSVVVRPCLANLLLFRRSWETTDGWCGVCCRSWRSMIVQDPLVRRELTSHQSIDPNAAEMYAIILPSAHLRLR